MTNTFIYTKTIIIQALRWWRADRHPRIVLRWWRYVLILDSLVVFWVFRLANRMIWMSISFAKSNSNQFRLNFVICDFVKRCTHSPFPFIVCELRGNSFFSFVYSFLLFVAFANRLELMEITSDGNIAPRMCGMCFRLSVSMQMCVDGLFYFFSASEHLNVFASIQ